MNDKDIQEIKPDSSFKFEIVGTSEGKTALWCVQCGMCSSNCPYSDTWEIKPHQVISMIQLGMRDKVLNSKSIWICATCYMCAERCPQGVEIANVMFALKNIATKEKGIPEGYRLFSQQVYNTGHGAEITTLRERERARMGLPKVPEVNIKSIRRLLKKTKLAKFIDKKEDKQ